MGVFPSSGTGCGCFCGCCDCGCGGSPPPDDDTVCSCTGCNYGIAKRWTLTISDWTNNTCSTCTTINGTYTLEYYQQSGTGSGAFCQFRSSAFAFCGNTCQWVFNANCNSAYANTLTLVNVVFPVVYAQYGKYSIISGCASNSFPVLINNNSGCNLPTSLSVTPIGSCDVCTSTACDCANCPTGAPEAYFLTMTNWLDGTCTGCSETGNNGTAPGRGFNRTFLLVRTGAGSCSWTNNEIYTSCSPDTVTLSYSGGWKLTIPNHSINIDLTDFNCRTGISMTTPIISGGTCTSSGVGITISPAGGVGTC